MKEAPSKSLIYMAIFQCFCWHFFCSFQDKELRGDAKKPQRNFSESDKAEEGALKVFHQDAVLFLREKAKAIAAEAIRWRCIHMDFSTLQNRCSEGLRNYAAHTVIDALNDEEGSIYLCRDGDLFVLFQGKVGDIVDKLGAHFKDIADPASTAQEGTTLYTLYDLSLERNWNEFLTRVTQKAELLQKKDEPALPPPSPPLRNLNAATFKAASAQRQGRKRLEVLVVEDDPFTRRLVTGTLKGDYDVIEAGDGAAAIHAYETHAPDAVFLDIQLPDTNGHLLLEKLLGFDPSAFIVMLSANSVKENILSALEHGAQGFATKPFAREKLIHYLRLCESTRRNHPATGAIHG